MRSIDEAASNARNALSHDPGRDEGAMFYPNLVCSIIVTRPDISFGIYAEAARDWLGGQDADRSESMLTWMEREGAEIEGSDWLSIDPFQFDSRRAILDLGSISDYTAIGVVTSLSAVTAALKQHVVQYLSARHIKSYACALDLGRFAQERWNAGEVHVRSFDARREDNAIISAGLLPRGTAAPSWEFELLAVGIDVNGVDVKVSPDFDMQLSPVDCSIESIGATLSHAVSAFEECSMIVDPRAASFLTMDGDRADAAATYRGSALEEPY